MKNKKSNLTFNLILIFLTIVGLSFLLYPSVSDYWNSFHQTQAVASYSDMVSGLSKGAGLSFMKARRLSHSFGSSLSLKYILYGISVFINSRYRDTAHSVLAVDIHYGV